MEHFNIVVTPNTEVQVKTFAEVVCPTTEAVQVENG